MRKRLILIGVAVAVVVVAVAYWPRKMATRPAPDTVAASGGDIVVAPIAHGTVQVEYGSHVILVDPTTSA